MVAKITLLESADKLIVPDSDMDCVGIFAFAEMTSRPLPEISTEKDEFLAALSINTLSSPGLFPVTSTMILPGRVRSERSNKADCCSPLFIGPSIVVEPPTISEPSEFFN